MKTAKVRGSEQPSKLFQELLSLLSANDCIGLH